MQRADMSFVDDVAHVRALAAASRVVLCGHSYGGTVITAATTGLTNIAHLIYVAAFAVDEGETSSDWYAKRPPSTPRSFTVLPDGRDLPQGWGVEDGRYGPEILARMRAIELRPQVVFPPVRISDPAWRRLPATYVVATSDSIIHPETQREMAARAGATVVELDTDHMVNIAAPEALAMVIDAVMDDIGPACV